MTIASVTAIQEALRDAINSGPVSVLVEVADSDVSKLQKTSNLEAQIAFSGIAELARTSSRILDQVLIDVNVSLRNVTGGQFGFDESYLAIQELRDLLIGFHIDGARVEQLITPNPFDQPKALAGQFSSRITLDMDVVRTIATVAPPEITDETVLTDTRGAVWDAIDNWPAFAATGDVPAAWVRKFKDPADIEELALHDPAAFDLPAITVTWGPTSPEWWTNVQQQWHQQIFITCWFPADWQAVAEWRLLQLMQAFYQSGETPSVSYIRRATGRPPSKNSPVSLELVALGRAQMLHAWKGQIALTLTSNLDPNA